MTASSLLIMWRVLARARRVELVAVVGLLLAVSATGSAAKVRLPLSRVDPADSSLVLLGAVAATGLVLAGRPAMLWVGGSGLRARLRRATAMSGLLGVVVVIVAAVGSVVATSGTLRLLVVPCYFWAALGMLTSRLHPVAGLFLPWMWLVAVVLVGQAPLGRSQAVLSAPYSGDTSLATSVLLVMAASFAWNVTATFSDGSRATSGFA